MRITRRTAMAGLACTAMGGPLPARAASRAPLKVMAFNVRLLIASDGPNQWRWRRALAARTIAAAAPDIIGTQELMKAQADDLLAALPRYGWFGVDRRGGHDDEHMAIFYRRDRLRPVRFGQFWLSDTPAVPGSISWGHPYPRMATWAVFETLSSGRRFFAINTHLPYRAQDEPAREKGAALLLDRIGDLASDLPVVVTGDFNTTPGSGTHTLLTGTLADAWERAETRSGPAETFHGFTGVADRRIDWILTRGFIPLRAATLTRPAGTRQISDHFPVVATLAWPGA